MNAIRKRLALWLVVFVVCLAAFLYQGMRTKRLASPPTAAVATSGPLTAGNPSAPIKVEAFYPLNPGHKAIGDYVLAFAKAHPDQVYVKVIDMQTPEGQKLWKTSGLTCAGVVTNGKTTHQVTRNGKTETVEFTKAMGGTWQKEDFVALVEQLSKAK